MELDKGEMMEAVIKEYKAERHTFGNDRPFPPPGVMQIVYKDGVPYAVDFICPCGCGSDCFTPVCTMAEKQDPNSSEKLRNRCWGFDEATLTIHPSIRYLSGCKAHFNVTNGKPVMHADSGK